jgi:outer membrane protein TolC
MGKSNKWLPCGDTSFNQKPMNRFGSKFTFTLAVTGLGALVLLTGCTGVQSPSEIQAREQVASVAAVYRPSGAAADLPALTTNSSLGEFLTYAMLNHPQVEAAYYDWLSSVENITVARSMPDPKLTFQAYIENSLTSLMPGLAQDFPGPGKLKAAGNAAAAESSARYFSFETAALKTAFSLKQAYYQLGLVDEKIQINRQMFDLLADLEKSARTLNEVGKATLQDVYRAQIEEDQLTTELANLRDSHNALATQFKGALGLTSAQADPPPPGRIEPSAFDLTGDALLEMAFARNPRLKEMEAEVRMAEDAIAVARKSNVPDFSAGLMGEVYRPPFYWPQASMTLPIWRDKIAAQIAGAQAGKRAAVARLSAEQIQVTVDFAMKAYEYRQITRNLSLLQDQLLPKAQKSLEIARSGYLGGQIDFFNLIDAERTLLGFRLSEVEARADRELAAAELSLLIAGIPPAGAPFTPDKTRNSK